MFCLRRYDSPHPYVYMLERRPDATLPRKGERSLECNICFGFMNEEYPVQSKTLQDQNRFLATLNQNRDNRTTFVNGVGKNETRKQERVGRYRLDEPAVKRLRVDAVERQTQGRTNRKLSRKLACEPDTDTDTF